MLLNIQDIATRLKEGEVIVKESALRSDMNDMLNYYKATHNLPKEIETLIKTGEVDLIELASLYFQQLARSSSPVKVEVKDQFVTLSL